MASEPRTRRKRYRHFDHPSEFSDVLAETVRGIGPVCIREGEIADINRSANGVFFRLMDQRTGPQCVLWRGALSYLVRRGFNPDSLVNGTKVRIWGEPDYYRGTRRASPKPQIKITYMVEIGKGDLADELARRRREFWEKGLFDLQKQLPRPKRPRRIAVITAKGGDARHDFLKALHGQGWFGHLMWAFTAVQNDRAVPAIINALEVLENRDDVDVIIVTRGGGSGTDLSVFNDPALCEAVAHLRVPVITAVGHEKDHHLIDDVAALKCSTPTAAARGAVERTAQMMIDELNEQARTRVVQVRRPLVAQGRRVERLIREVRAGLDAHRLELERSAEEVNVRSTRQLMSMSATLDRKAVAFVGDVRSWRLRLDRLSDSLSEASRERCQLVVSALGQRQERIDEFERLLTLRDPKRQLSPGEVMLVDLDSGRVMTNVAGLATGRRMRILLHDGHADVSVMDVVRNPSS